MAQSEHEVVVQIPEMGLDEKQLKSLKDTFENHLVSTMGAKSAAAPRTIKIVFKIQRQF